tara:strand:- start:1585 stop:1923 length:339 start_codon:yes stop_codon:yes gene_type:complete
MIISCECGIQFEVGKNEIPKEGRNVQCGVCNKVWFQTPYEKIDKNLQGKTSHYFANLFFLLLIIVSFVGIMETFKDDVIYNFPEIEKYYLFIENTSNNFLKEIKYLFSSFGI